MRHQSGGWEELDTLAGRVSRREDRIWGEGSAAKILAMHKHPCKRLCSVACNRDPVQGGRQEGLQRLLASQATSFGRLQAQGGTCLSDEI